jgi:hypothetical protein
LPTQATLIIIPETLRFVNTFFQKNLKKLKSGFSKGFSGYVEGKGAPCAQAVQDGACSPGQAPPSGILMEMLSSI